MPKDVLQGKRCFITGAAGSLGAATARRCCEEGAAVAISDLDAGAVEALARLDVEIDPDRQVASLSVAEQQFVEIAKAISRDMTLLILDEPTASMPTTEAHRLFQTVDRLRAQGLGILLVTDHLDEI